MSKVFWDTMLFIHLLEGRDARADQVAYLLERSKERGDSLFTSHLAVGELLAGAERYGGSQHAGKIQNVLHEMGFMFLPFDAGAVVRFGQLRGERKLKVADAIHLSCAASAKIDLFLTGDRQLHRLIVPGVQFIADFDVAIL